MWEGGGGGTRVVLSAIHPRVRAALAPWRGGVGRPVLHLCLCGAVCVGAYITRVTCRRRPGIHTTYQQALARLARVRYGTVLHVRGSRTAHCPCAGWVPRLGPPGDVVRPPWGRPPLRDRGGDGDQTGRRAVPAREPPFIGALDAVAKRGTAARRCTRVCWPSTTDVQAKVALTLFSFFFCFVICRFLRVTFQDSRRRRSATLYNCTTPGRDVAYRAQGTTA